MSKSSTTISTPAPASAPASCKAEADAAALARRAAVSEAETLIETLTPPSVRKADGLDPIKPSERVAARRVLVHLWADIDAKRPCPAAGLSVRLSDGSALPFRLWAETVIGIREPGKAHAVSVA